MRPIIFSILFILFLAPIYAQVRVSGKRIDSAQIQPKIVIADTIHFLDEPQHQVHKTITKKALAIPINPKPADSTKIKKTVQKIKAIDSTKIKKAVAVPIKLKTVDSTKIKKVIQKIKAIDSTKIKKAVAVPIKLKTADSTKIKKVIQKIKAIDSTKIKKNVQRIKAIDSTKIKKTVQKIKAIDSTKIKKAVAVPIKLKTVDSTKIKKSVQKIKAIDSTKIKKTVVIPIKPKTADSTKIKKTIQKIKNIDSTKIKKTVQKIKAIDSTKIKKVAAVPIKLKIADSTKVKKVVQKIVDSPKIPKTVIYKRDATQLKIISYNIRHGVGNDGRINLLKLVDLIKKHDPDIVALQEIDSGMVRSGKLFQARILSLLTGYDEIYGKAVQTQEGNYGLAILTKHSYQDFQNIPLPSPEATEPRNMLSVVVTLPNSRLIRFCNTQLDYKSPLNRGIQAALISKNLGFGLYPTVLCGNFNAAIDDHTVDFLPKYWDNAGQHDDSHTHIPTDRRIDYCWTSKGNDFKLCKYQVLTDVKMSDHYPILIVYELSK